MKKLIPYNRIAHAAKQCAKSINEARENNPILADKPLVYLSVLNDSILWASEVIKETTVSNKVDFIQLLKNKKGEYSVDIEPDLNLKGCHVIILTGLVSSANKMRVVKEYLLSKQDPEWIDVCTLLAREGVVEYPKYLGYLIGKNDYVVGFGINNAESHRGDIKNIYHKTKK